MKGPWQAAGGLGGYLALILAPFAVLILAPTPARHGFWWEVGIGLGFGGLIMMALQFLLTARLRRLTAPYGIDVIYYFHRYLAYVLGLIVLAHPVLLILGDPTLPARLNPASASWAMLSGLLSAGLLLLLIGSSAARKLLRLPYNHWRRLHLLLAVAAVALAFAHMQAIGYYSGNTLASGFWSLIGLALLAIVVHVRLIRPWRLSRRPWRLTQLTAEQGNAWTLTLSPEGHPGIRFLPGQFAWLSLGHSPFIMEDHPFSIASAPRDDGSIRFTIKALGDFTSKIGELAPASRAYVDGPYGVFSCNRFPDAPGYVFIAGGIGIAPMIGMLEDLAQRGDRRSHVLFTAHSRLDRVPRLDTINALAGQLDLTVVSILEEPPPDWTGETGWISREKLQRHLPRNHETCQYFICGPQAMTQAAERYLAELGVPMRRIHTELFDMA